MQFALLATLGLALSVVRAAPCDESQLAANQVAINEWTLDDACAVALGKTTSETWYSAFQSVDTGSINTFTTQYCGSSACVALTTSVQEPLTSCTDTENNDLYSQIQT
ncbi:hypothetical protein AaE_008782, partial [Aphanomyces astaci]